MNVIAFFDGRIRGAKGLRDDLPTIDAAPWIDGADPDKNVRAVGFEGHQRLEIGHIEGHTREDSALFARPERLEFQITQGESIEVDT